MATKNEIQPTNTVTSTSTSVSEDQHSNRDILRGLVYTHNRANTNTAELHQACASIHAMVELLVERGLLDREILEVKRQKAAEKLREQYIERGIALGGEA